MRQFGIVAIALVAHESMCAIDFEPLESRPRFLQPRLDFVPAFQRNMRVLPAPDVKQLPFDLTRARQRVVLLPRTQAARVNIRRVETSRG